MAIFPSFMKIISSLPSKVSSLFISLLSNHLYVYYNGPHLPMLFSSKGCTNSCTSPYIFLYLVMLSFTSLYTFTYMFALLLNHLFTYIQLFHRNPVFFCSIYLARYEDLMHFSVPSWFVECSISFLLWHTDVDIYRNLLCNHKRSLFHIRWNLVADANYDDLNYEPKVLLCPPPASLVTLPRDNSDPSWFRSIPTLSRTRPFAWPTVISDHTPPTPSIRWTHVTV